MSTQSLTIEVMDAHQRKAICDVLHERKAQQKKWGEQNHEMPIWLAILHEETGELSECVLHRIFGGPQSEKQLGEAIQVAAVALQIVEYLRRQQAINPHIAP